MLFIASFAALLRLCFALSLGFLVMLFVVRVLFLVFKWFLACAFLWNIRVLRGLVSCCFWAPQRDCNDGKYIPDEQTNIHYKSLSTPNIAPVTKKIKRYL